MPLPTVKEALTVVISVSEEATVAERTMTDAAVASPAGSATELQLPDTGQADTHFLTGANTGMQGTAVDTDRVTVRRAVFPDVVREVVITVDKFTSQSRQR